MGPVFIPLSSGPWQAVCSWLQVGLMLQPRRSQSDYTGPSTSGPTGTWERVSRGPVRRQNPGRSTLWCDVWGGSNVVTRLMHVQTQRGGSRHTVSERAFLGPSS